VNAQGAPSQASSPREPELISPKSGVNSNESEERAEDFEELESAPSLAGSGHQLDLLDSEFVPDFGDEADDEASSHVPAEPERNLREVEFRPGLSADDGLGIDEDIYHHSSSRRTVNPSALDELEEPQNPGRLGIRHEIDIEDAPGVKVSWPGDNSGTVFEADLRRVHSQLIKSVRSAASQNFDRPPSAKEAVNRNSPVASIPVEVTEEFANPPSFLTTSEAAPEQSFSPGGLFAEFAKTTPAIPEIPPEEAQAEKPKKRLIRISDFDEAVPVEPIRVPAAPKLPIEKRSEQAASPKPISSSLEELLPANAAFREEEYADEDPSSFAPLVAKPEDIWRDSTSVSGTSIPLGKNQNGKARKESNISSYSKRLADFGLGVCGSVPLALTFGVWWWSGHLSMTPEPLKKYFYIEPSGLSQVAPPGLEVKDLHSAFITLDDGSQVLEIQGNIFNGTKSAIGRVKLEAKVFDKANNEVGKLLVDSHLALAEANIQALSSKALKSMQEESASSFVRLNPNDSSKFRVVFTDLGSLTNGKTIEWFSTRIYSIEPLSS